MQITTPTSHGVTQDLELVDRAFFAANPFGRKVADAASSYVAAHGRIGEGSLPIVYIPGFLNDAADMRGMRYFLRELGFPTAVVDTRLRGTASVFGDAAAAAKLGEQMMRQYGTDQYILMGYSRGGLGIEAMRTRMPEQFAKVASVVYVNSPISPPKDGTGTPALKLLGKLSKLISSGGRELEADPSIWKGWIDTRASGLKAAQQARPDFRAVSFKAPKADVVTTDMAILPVVEGVTQNIVSRGGGGHMIGLGLDVDANTHLAEVLAALPVNAARRAE